MTDRQLLATAALILTTVVGSTASAVAQQGVLPDTPANRAHGVVGCMQTSSGITCPGAPSGGGGGGYDGGAAALSMGMALGNVINQAFQEMERQRIQAAFNNNNKGIALYRSGRYRESVAAFETALQYKPGDTAIQSNLAMARKAWTQQQQAIAAAHRAKMAAAKKRVSQMIGGLADSLTSDAAKADAAAGLDFAGGSAPADGLAPAGTAFFGLGGGPGGKPQADASGLQFVGPRQSLFSHGTKYSAPVDLRSTASDQLASAAPIGADATPAPVDSGGGLQFVPVKAKPVPVNPATTVRHTATYSATITPPALPKATRPAPPVTVATAESPAMAGFIPPTAVRHLSAGTPRAAARMPTCYDLAGKEDKLRRLTGRAILAEDVYKRYAPPKSSDAAAKPTATEKQHAATKSSDAAAKPTTAEKQHAATKSSDTAAKKTPDDPPLFHRVSDNLTEMQTLFPHMSKKALQDWLAPPHSDYRAAIYRYKNPPKGEENKYFLVFRGTITKGDVAADFKQAIGQRTEYYAKAIGLAKLLKKAVAQKKAVAPKKGWSLELVGHSLGGGMADAAGAVNHIPTTSFNPSGVHPNTVAEYGPDVIKNAPKYDTDYVVNGEPLHLAQDHPYAAIATAAAVGPVAAAAIGTKSPAVAAGAGVTMGAMSPTTALVTGGAAGWATYQVAANHALPPSIGKREPLPASPQDKPLDPVNLKGDVESLLDLHGIAAVRDAIANQWNAVRQKMAKLGCPTAHTASKQ